MTTRAVQVYLQDVFLDRPPAGAVPGAYVVTMIRASTGGMAQVWISQPSFKLAKWQPKVPGAQPAYGWDGAGRLVFSTALDALDALEIQVLLIRDRSKSRAAGATLERLLGAGVGGKKVADAAVAGLAGEALEKALQGLQVAGAVLEVTGAVLGVIGKALRESADAVLIDGSGTLLRSDLLRGREGVSEVVAEHGFEIGRKSTGDRGFFKLSVRTPDLRDGAAFTPLRLPPEVEDRLARSAPVLGG
jgi:hypothetical protein